MASISANIENAQNEEGLHMDTPVGAEYKIEQHGATNDKGQRKTWYKTFQEGKTFAWNRALEMLTEIEGESYCLRSSSTTS